MARNDGGRRLCNLQVKIKEAFALFGDPLQYGKCSAASGFLDQAA
jgi:hypothetical protein